MTIVRVRFTILVRCTLLMLHALGVIGIAALHALTSRRVVLFTLTAIGVACRTYHRTLAVMSAVGRM
jgi:hypothetical protein